MNREIKFRGLRTDGKGWVYGNLINWHPNLKPRIIWFIENALNVDGFEETNFEVHHESVSQFTGLKDKNGQEIYEGDVVEIYGNKAQVIFKNGCFKFFTKNISGGFLSWQFCKEETVIIGNIYEL